MERRNVVITNDVTAQARALNDYLNSIRSPRFRHRGLFPNPRFHAATKLSYPSIGQLPGDINLPWKVFETLVKQLWSLFLVTLPGRNEELDAKQLIYAAINNGVSHIVLLSAAYDRNAPQTDPGCAAKVSIERFMKDEILTQEAHQVSWTVLKPVVYYDLINPGSLGEAYARSFQQLRFNAQMDLVAMEDVARAAARVLGDPELYNGKSIVLVGDQLNFIEMNKIFREEVGRDIPLAPVIRPGFGNGTFHFSEITPVLREFHLWQERGGFRVHPSLVRTAQPNMLTFRMWVRKSRYFHVRP